jgi:hypothetical protein
MIVCYVLLISFTFKFPLLTSDISSLAAIVLISLIYIIQFTFINSKNFDEIIGKKIQDFELLSYKTMFNCLQEGILVLDGSKYNSESSFSNKVDDISTFFSNHLCSIMLSKVLKKQTPKSEEEKLTLGKRSLKKPIFYMYQSSSQIAEQ